MEEFRQVVAVFDSGAIKPVIDQRHTLADVKAAFDRLHRREQFGKLVVTMAS